MKKIQYLFLGLIVIAGACDKEDEKQIEISNEHAADMVANSLVSEDGGLMTIFNQSASIAADYGAGSSTGKVASPASVCGFSDATTFAFESQPDADPSFSMKYDYAFMINCDENDEISVMDLTMTYSGFLSTQDLSASYEGETDFTIDGFSEDFITYNGSYNGKINTDISGDQPSTLDLDYDYTLTDIKFNTENFYLVSGSAAVKLSGKTDEGSFDIVASVTYHDNYTATIVVNSESFTADLETGVVTRD